MTGWLTLSEPEFAFLATTEDDAEGVLGLVGLAGAWLRDAKVRAAGERIFAARIEATPEVAPAGWVTVTAAVQAVARSRTGSLLALKGGERKGFLLTAGGSQVVADPEGLAVRYLGSGLEPALLADELDTAFAPRTVYGIRTLSVGGNEEHAAWADGRWQSSREREPMQKKDALTALSTFALEVLDGV